MTEETVSVSEKPPDVKWAAWMLERRNRAWRLDRDTEPEVEYFPPDLLNRGIAELLRIVKREEGPSFLRRGYDDLIRTVARHQLILGAPPLDGQLGHPESEFCEPLACGELVETDRHGAFSVGKREAANIKARIGDVPRTDRVGDTEEMELRRSASDERARRPVGENSR